MKADGTSAGAEREGWLRALAAVQALPADRAAIDWALCELARLRADLAIATEALLGLKYRGRLKCAQECGDCPECNALDALTNLTGKGEAGR